MSLFISVASCGYTKGTSKSPSRVVEMRGQHSKPVPASPTQIRSLLHQRPSGARAERGGKTEGRFKAGGSVSGTVRRGEVGNHCPHPLPSEHAVVLWYSSRRAQQRADTKRAANSTTSTLGRGRRKGDGAGSCSNQVHRMLYLRIGAESKLGCAACGLGTSTFFRNLHHVSCVQYGSTEYGWVLLFLSFVPGPITRLDLPLLRLGSFNRSFGKAH